MKQPKDKLGTTTRLDNHGQPRGNHHGTTTGQPRDNHGTPRNNHEKTVGQPRDNRRRPACGEGRDK
eukprot:6270386-Pyramimonas_sp.AAC.1